MSVPIVQLGDLVWAHYGKALKQEDRDPTGSIIVYGSSGEVGHHRDALIQEPTIVVGRKGSVGAITFAPNGGWVIDTAYFLERKTPSQLDLRYLFYALRRVDLAKDTITTSIPGLNRDDLLANVIRVPAIDDQRHIAAILDKADSLRRKRQASFKFADSLLRAAFFDRCGDPVTNSLSWPERPVSEVGTVTTGNTPSRDVKANFGDAIEWIKSDNINTPSHVLTRSREGLSDLGARIGRIAPAGSILMTCIAGSPSVIGNVALADRRVAFNQQINAITPNQGIEPEFLYTLLLFSKPRIQAASTNSMKGMVSKGALEKVRLIWPPANVQREIADLFRKVKVLTGRMERANPQPLLSALQHRLFADPVDQ